MVLTPSDYEKLSKGDMAPDFNLPGIDGKNHSLSEFSDTKALLIVFMCNHCPYVIPKFDYLIELQSKYGDLDFQLVGINSNDPTDHPEDSFDNMVRIANDRGFNFPYLFDESQDVARAYGAVCTPDPFLFDNDQKLAYHGRLDDAHGKFHDEATTSETEDAIKLLLDGKPVDLPDEPSLGCSIKWKR
jgi:peroxiredoxin